MSSVEHKPSSYAAEQWLAALPELMTHDPATIAARTAERLRKMRRDENGPARLVSNKSLAAVGRVALQAEGGLTRSDIKARLELSYPQVSRVLRTMLDLGAIQVVDHFEKGRKDEPWKIYGPTRLTDVLHEHWPEWQQESLNPTPGDATPTDQ